MKRLWLAGGLFGIVLILCVTTLRFQQRHITELLHTLEAVDTAFTDDALDKAHTLAIQLEADYDRRTALFPCFMNHDDLIACRESVRLLPSILKDGNAEEFHMESARCRAHLERLIESEQLTWQTIL